MNPTRTILLFAWLTVAAFLWMEWSKERSAPPAPAATEQSAPSAAIPTLIPGQPAATVPNATSGVPAAATAAATPTPAANASSSRVTVTTDVLRLVLDGGNVFDAELLQYPQTREKGSPPVKLLDESSAHYYVAQSGWTGQNGASAPNHVNGFVAENPANTNVALTTSQREISVPFVWNGPDGVTIRRIWTIKRGSYAIEVRDEVANAGGKPWAGYVYRQLARIPPEQKSGMTNPESYSFLGATWLDADQKYQRRKFKDFAEDGPVNITVTGGWIAMLQHHFLSVWIPQPDQAALFSLAHTGRVDSIAATGPAFTVAPGAKEATSARLWVGPKLVKQIQAQGVPKLDRAVDYSQYSFFAMLGEGLFWVLDKLHGLFGNWGWTIIGMVLLLKLLLFPLSAAQYKSAAKMRKFQPRVAQLKERYGDDKQKFQLALMELYKKEKINPVGGCLPIIPQMIIFMALYWVLMESVELRQAPWTLWIQDLTARDPFFILPIINMAIMWTTQKLTPAVGMDPMQQKMMQMMPLIFGVILAFLPAGLVLYQVANGGLGLLQQWLMLKKYSDPPAGKSVAEKA